MSEAENDQPSEEGGLLSKISDLAFDAITGTSIPAPVRRNAVKAFGQLCTAAIDLPVAYLEGRAKEMRATSDARVKLISTSGEKIADQIEVPAEYARSAVLRYGQKIVRERVNLDKICNEAARQLSEGDTAEDKNNPDEPEALPSGEDVKEIESDWLNSFEDVAGPRSSEDMQKHLSRILAGEIQKPGSFSVRTLKLVGNLDAGILSAFQRFCSLCISLGSAPWTVDARVVALSGNAASNGLSKYGFSFGQLNVLNEYGLIISDYNSYMDYVVTIARNHNGTPTVPVAFDHGGKSWALIPQNPDQPLPKSLKLYGVGLSKAGRELLPVIEIVPNENYSQALKEFFVTKGMQMCEARRSL